MLNTSPRAPIQRNSRPWSHPITWLILTCAWIPVALIVWTQWTQGQYMGEILGLVRDIRMSAPVKIYKPNPELDQARDTVYRAARVTESFIVDPISLQNPQARALLRGMRAEFLEAWNKILTMKPTDWRWHEFPENNVLLYSARAAALDRDWASVRKLMAAVTEISKLPTDHPLGLWSNQRRQNGLTLLLALYDYDLPPDLRAELDTQVLQELRLFARSPGEDWQVFTRELALYIGPDNRGEFSSMNIWETGARSKIGSSITGRSLLTPMILQRLAMHHPDPYYQELAQEISQSTNGMHLSPTARFFGAIALANQRNSLIPMRAQPLFQFASLKATRMSSETVTSHHGYSQFQGVRANLDLNFITSTLNLTPVEIERVRRGLQSLETVEVTTATAGAAMAINSEESRFGWSRKGLEAHEILETTTSLLGFANTTVTLIQWSSKRGNAEDMALFTRNLNEQTTHTINSWEIPSSTRGLGLEWAVTQMTKQPGYLGIGYTKERLVWTHNPFNLRNRDPMYNPQMGDVEMAEKWFLAGEGDPKLWQRARDQGLLAVLPPYGSDTSDHSWRLQLMWSSTENVPIVRKLTILSPSINHFRWQPNFKLGKYSTLMGALDLK